MNIHKSILVVDDNVMVLDSVGVMLETLGWSVQKATAGQEAIDWLASDQGRVDVILLDYDMPDMNGIDVMRRLASAGIHVPVILSTGHGNVPNDTSVQPDGWLHKPFRSATLQDCIDKALGSG